MLAQYLDLTEDFNNSSVGIVFEVSNYDYCLIQVINNQGDGVTFQATIDSGAVQSITDGSALTAINFTTVAATNVLDGSLMTTTGGADSIYRLNVIGRFIKLFCSGGDTNVGKLLIMLAKIS